MTKILSSLEIHYIRTTYMGVLLYIVIYRETTFTFTLPIVSQKSVQL